MPYTWQSVLGHLTGGFDLAALWLGWQNIFQVENNKFCQKHLQKRFPFTDKHSDIRNFDGTKYANQIDVLSGGFPCQPFSLAGKGSLDLTLWKEMLRVIEQVEPSSVLAENVPGIVGRKNAMAFRVVCADLEAAGYEILPLNIPVAGKGAPHERERIWFVAHSDRLRRKNRLGENSRPQRPPAVLNQQRNNPNQGKKERIAWNRARKSNSGITHRDIISFQRSVLREFGSVQKQIEKSQRSKLGGTLPAIKQWEEDWISVASRLCRMDDGLPDRMDQIMALGNSISPVLAYDFFQIIEIIHETKNQAEIQGY